MDAYQDQSMGAWYRALDDDTRTKLRALHKINPYGNLIIVYLALIWAGTAIIMHTFPVWPVRLAGYMIIGLIMHGYGNVMHEGIHGNMFRDPKWDRWFGVLAGIPPFVSATAYRVVHLLHHRYNRTEEDPDELTNFTQRPFFRRMTYYLWFVVGIYIYLYVRLPWLALRYGTPVERKRILAEYTIIIVVVSGVVTLASLYGFTDGLLHYWLIPGLFGGQFANLRGWAEHMMTKKGHPLTETRTVTSSKVLSFLNLNLNYHLEHHLFPAVPWYNLPRVHALLQDEYKKAGASIYSSYIRFFFDAWKRGFRDEEPDPAITTA